MLGLSLPRNPCKTATSPSLPSAGVAVGTFLPTGSRADRPRHFGRELRRSRVCCCGVGTPAGDDPRRRLAPRRHDLRIRLQRSEASEVVAAWCRVVRSLRFRLEQASAAVADGRATALGDDEMVVRGFDVPRQRVAPGACAPLGSSNKAAPLDSRPAVASGARPAPGERLVLRVGMLLLEPASPLVVVRTIDVLARPDRLVTFVRTSRFCASVRSRQR